MSSPLAHGESRWRSSEANLRSGRSAGFSLTKEGILPRR